MKAGAWRAVAVAVVCAGCQRAPAPEAPREPTSLPAVVARTRPAEPRQAHTEPLRQAIDPDVLFVPTPQPVVDAMLALAEVGPGDVLYDLGSGDGRIPITAAKRHGIRAVGIEIDAQLVAQARANARAAGVAHLVAFREQDLFLADIDEASVVTLYLLDRLNEQLRPKLLRDLAPGTRIVSHAFRMGDWEPEATREIGASTIFLWRVPPRGKDADGRPAARRAPP